MPTTTLAISRSMTFRVALFAGLMIAAVLLPFIKLQPVTGTLVNATLFIAVASLGVKEAVLIALIPSVVSLSVGLLPAALAPMIPFIMIGNVILILLFDSLGKLTYWQRAVISAIGKCAFIFIASSLIASLISVPAIAAKIPTMLGWIQLLTALAGSLVAYFIIPIAKKR